MSRCVGVLGLVLLLLCSAVVADESKTAEGDVQAVIQLLHAYEEAWSRHDAHAIAGFYYEPAMRVSPAGPSVRATRAMQEAFFSGFLPSLLQQGYATSTWEHLEVRLLDANTAVASGVIVRHRGDDSVFQRQGVTYTLWRSEEGWKIFLSATHSPSTALRFH
jgi:ketosteroid isomerase-like protein